MLPASTSSAFKLDYALQISTHQFRKYFQMKKIVGLAEPYYRRELLEILQKCNKSRIYGQREKNEKNVKKSSEIYLKSKILN